MENTVFIGASGVCSADAGGRTHSPPQSSIVYLSTSIALPCRVSCPSTRPSPWPRAALLQTLTFNSDNQGSDRSLAGSLDSSVTQTCMCVTSPPCEQTWAERRGERASFSSERVNRKACPQTHDAAWLRWRFCQTGVRLRRRAPVKLPEN